MKLNKKIMMTAILMTAVMSMTACGKDKGNGNQGNGDVQQATSSNLPVDVEETGLDYATTELVTDAVVLTTQTTTETVETTETTTETTPVEAGNESGGSSGGSGSSGGMAERPEYDINARNSKAILSLFSVRYRKPDGGVLKAEHNFWDINTMEKLLDKRSRDVLPTGEFTMIDGETYNGSFNFVYDFYGQAYWFAGEGSPKMYVESNDAGEITAIAFSDIGNGGYNADGTKNGEHQFWEMEFSDRSVFWSNSENGFYDYGIFDRNLLDMNDKPWEYIDNESGAYIRSYNDGYATLAYERVGDAVKSVIIFSNKR